ncbi:Non-canonical poly(A) RNA polymerase papd5 [Globomyces sp. JEL0801]|nr:Non-canonical poly(A) RNA polymerase papd5 [Globomyces sp. JEL0801]
MSKPFSFRQEVVQNHIKKIQSQESPNQKLMTPKKKNIPYTFPHSLMNIPTASAYAQIENTPPWLNSTIDPIDPYKCLDIDIYDFVQFISPGDLELQMRKDVVDRVGSLLKASDNESLKNVKLESFGSYANGLYLPTSDIDMIILDPKETFLTANQCGSKLQRFLHKFRKAGYNAVFIYSSKVPILKLVDSKTLIDIDISYSAESATQVLSATKLSISYQKQYPFLKPLVLVLKQFLLLRDLNSNAKCGIGGYALLLLVVSFLKIQ